MRERLLKFPQFRRRFVRTHGLEPFPQIDDPTHKRPFAILIVGGLISDLVNGIFLLPTLYVWMARDHDVLPAVETEAVQRDDLLAPCPPKNRRLPAEAAKTPR
jgi:hypothetical protein